MSTAQSAIDKDSDLAIAWDAYKASDSFQNSRKWALHIAPIVQSGDPDAELKRACELMPFEQRKRHVEGSLWAAFMAGWNAAGGKL